MTKGLLHFLDSTSQKGQTLVVLLLILVVTLTIGLSVVSKTITNVRESSTTERSSRAFSAAEAGIESVLRQDLAQIASQQQSGATPIPFTVGDGSTSVTVQYTGANSGAYQPVKPVSKDDVIQIDLQGGGLTATRLDISWSLAASADEYSSACSKPAASLEIAAVTYDGANYDVARQAYNANTCPGSISNGFTAASNGSATGFVSTVRYDIPVNAKILRLRPLYNNASIRVAPASGTIPVQSYKIRSEGIAGDTKRVVEVERSLGGLPSIFDYVVFNGSSSTPLSK